ncbi:glutamine-hydrolyzing carbamoyl-phosphate synthase small subunit [Alphaproteobacteria bacterium]|nr:glutamine-hydrolyzing carbamoyl-phosphate synthase small subunit [Alphaproteobacteria bacterium]
MQQNNDTTPFTNIPNAALILENKKVFWGKGIGAKTAKIGELCFNTSQTGYQEILTDPSYAKQIITFTFPHIGIVGVNKLDIESKKIYASGCILNQTSNHYSSWRSNSDIELFFKQNNVPCITNIDTRQLTRMLASHGAMKAAIIHFENDKKNFDELKNKLDKWNGLENLDLASFVSTQNSYNTNESIWDIEKNSYTNRQKSTYNICCIDFGIKKNILRNLNNCNFSTTVIPTTASIDDIINTKPKGIFLSNGPGDPFATGEIIIPKIREIIKRKIPIFGICLGHQILSLALGAKTKKMFQGHRGGNHPVKNLITKKVEITSQNHGFEVDRISFPKDIIETHISLFDGTNEGMKHKDLPIFSVQYHPEASPGPHDSHYLFNQFYELVKKYA